MEAHDTADLIRVTDVLRAILAERERQQWGAAHDYTHSMVEWAGLITRYVGRIADDGLPVEQAQASLIKAAALCVAAIQAMELWSYGPNPAAAMNALAAKIKALSEPGVEE